MKNGACIMNQRFKKHSPYPLNERNKKAPSGRELAAKLTEGECVTVTSVYIQTHAGSFHRKRSPADCQASATPQKTSKGDFQLRHFLGRVLIKYTTYSNSSSETSLKLVPLG